MNVHQAKAAKPRFCLTRAGRYRRSIGVGKGDRHDAAASIEKHGNRVAEFECEGGERAYEFRIQGGGGRHTSAVQVPQPFDLPFLEAGQDPMHLVDRTLSSQAHRMTRGYLCHIIARSLAGYTRAMNQSPSDVVIVATARTPIGAFQGALAPLPAPRLGAVALRGALERAGAKPEDVDLVLQGNVLQAGQGQAPARQAAKYAGIPDATPSATLNKMCGSGLEAIIQGARALMVGDAMLVAAGGFESMSNAPYLLPGARGGLRLGHAQALDSIIHDGLWDVYEDVHMGSCAEACAREFHFSREDQDAFAERSYRRAQAASESGVAANEIVPVEVPGRKGTVTVVEHDEGPAAVNFDKLPNLRPAFEKDGTVTAANASSINDGAAAVLITTRAHAESKGYPIVARLVGWSSHAQAPFWFTTAPLGAMRTLFDKIGWDPADVDRYEINEAFSVVTMAAIQTFDLPEEKVDALGGAVALGHPIGASGARIVVTLLNALEQSGGRKGMAAICIGGGEALALAIERETA